MDKSCCGCPVGSCKAFYGEDDLGKCLLRLDGDVSWIPCETCGYDTLHHDLECLKCREKKERRD